MPRKVLADVNDIEQIRDALQDTINLMTELGWTRDDMACWLHMMAEKLVEAE